LQASTLPLPKTSFSFRFLYAFRVGDKANLTIYIKKRTTFDNRPPAPGLKGLNCYICLTQ
jgi:hypothetical protein